MKARPTEKPGQVLELPRRRRLSPALFSAKTTVFETPPEVFGPLHAEFHFELDAAASKGNAKCGRFWTAEDDALRQPWAPFRTFVNPPYGRDIGRWLVKAREEQRRGALVVLLLPARTDTRWFHEHIISAASELRFIRGRVVFHLDGKPIVDRKGRPIGAPFPNLLAIYKPSSPTIATGADPRRGPRGPRGAVRPRPARRPPG